MSGARELRQTPIIFKPELVRAILRDEKTQTRRIVRPERCPKQRAVAIFNSWCVPGHRGAFGCPYGEPGDLLWVKETWRPRRITINIRGAQSSGILVQYPADGGVIFYPQELVPKSWRFPSAAERSNVSPLFLPRWAARLVLRLRRIQLQRLQGITDEEALAEGVKGDEGRTPREAFAALWNVIHDGGWSVDPWVWVLAFERMKSKKPQSSGASFVFEEGAGT